MPGQMTRYQNAWAAGGGDYRASHPEAGDVIPETGGLRKLRWVAKGKRGGWRVIY